MDNLGEKVKITNMFCVFYIS